MDVDSDHAVAVQNVDDWLARFSPVAGSKPGAFPFTSRKIQSIESRRARMSDLLIFDVLLVRGGIRNPDMLFPPADWASLRKLLDAIDQSVYDILKKDCLVYILLKWAWDMDPKETNPGWDTRYFQDRCIAPQFAALADAYWLLDTGIHLAKAVSILSDARLNRDYVSKILQALALSSSPASFSSGTAPATAALVVNYVRTAKPLLTEPDDIDLYTLSLAHLSFMDAWAYQRSFPEGGDTRERLLGKIVGWCLMPLPKQESLAQLLAFPLSSYEQSALYTLALPSQFSTSSSLSGVNTHATTTTGPVLSSQAISILQDLLCVRAIQSGDYVRAIKLDRQFSSVSPSLGNAASSSSIASQATLSGRDTIDRKSIIQDLFATLPPAERTLLEDEIGKVATGVRANTLLSFASRQGAPAPARRPLMTDLNLSASWEDIGAGRESPTPSASVSVSSSAVGAGFAGKATPIPVSTTTKVNQSSFSTSPFASHAPRPQLASSHQVPPIPKFTAFGSPIPATTGASTGRGVIIERGKTLFAINAAGGPSAPVKSGTRVSLFDTAGSAKNAPNAFYKPPSTTAGTASLDTRSALARSSTAKSPGQGTNTTKQNGKTQGGENDGEDVSMGSRSDVEIIEEDHRDESGGEEQEEATADEDEDDVGNFITYDKSGAADLTLHPRHVDELMSGDDEAEVELGFSVFSGRRNAVQTGSAGENRKKGVSGNGHTPYASPPPHTHVSPPREGDKSLSLSVNSTTTSKRRAPPGAFHHEEEDEDEDQRDANENEHNEEDENKEDNRASTPLNSPRRSTRARMQSQTPPRPSARPQPQRTSKSTTTATGGTSRPSTRTGRTSSSRLSLSQPIPGALMDEDNDEHGQDDVDYTDTHRDEDAELDGQEGEDGAIAPLPSRASRRTRSSGHVGASMTTSTKSKSGAKLTAPAGVTAAATAGKGKTKARPSEVKTPARRSSRLSTAESVSPDHIEVVSPTKKGRKSTASRASIAGSGSGAAATRSSTRQKRRMQAEDESK